ncbi:unnamed protein product [Prunus armeniaca]|uniref:Uncharacterized protein n=1 Tax=Prunus armeniaca TaxID=36596 RepID=A0A6J5WTI6_PRUAR|nr:unnamed protein product [Prunus armeniaca]
MATNGLFHRSINLVFCWLSWSWREVVRPPNRERGGVREGKEGGVAEGVTELGGRGGRGVIGVGARSRPARPRPSVH